METRTLATTAIAPSDVPIDRLFRMSPDVYQGMLEHGLLPEGKVALVDGLLVDEATEQLHPITINVYNAMVEHDLLTKYDKIELLDGLMVAKMTKGGPHIMSTYYVGEALRTLHLAGFHIKTEQPVALPTGPTGRGSVPEPDVSLVRGEACDYPTGQPGPENVALVAEVTDSTRRKDRTRLVRYAWSKVPVVWIVNVVDGNVEVHSEPTGPTDLAKYETVTLYGPHDRISVVIDGREVGQIAVKDVLPRAPR